MKTHDDDDGLVVAFGITMVAFLIALGGYVVDNMVRWVVP
jgi:hypothetical protein